jgi:hypothetical protein
MERNQKPEPNQLKSFPRRRRLGSPLQKCISYLPPSTTTMIIQFNSIQFNCFNIWTLLLALHSLAYCRLVLLTRAEPQAWSPRANYASYNYSTLDTRCSTIQCNTVPHLRLLNGRKPWTRVKKHAHRIRHQATRKNTTIRCCTLRYVSHHEPYNRLLLLYLTCTRAISLYK